MFSQRLLVGNLKHRYGMESRCGKDVVQGTHKIPRVIRELRLTSGDGDMCGHELKIMSKVRCL